MEEMDELIDLLKRNPAVDIGQLEAWREYRRKVHAERRGARSRIVPPAFMPKPREAGAGKDDPRTVIIRYRL